MEPGVNRKWAYVVEDAGKASAVSRVEAVARRGQASLLWIQLNGRDSGTLEWLRDRCGIPYPAFLALTAVETRPRADFLDSGAIINLRGLGATPHDDPDTLVSIRLWARSEEHTSELQSLMRISYAVFCLKKKKKNHKYYEDNT